MTEFNEIFNEELFKDLTQLKQNVPQVHTEFIVSNLLASASLFTNNRFLISPKNHPKTSTNLYIMNVAGSGCGKSISSKPFINTLGMMQKNERELSIIEKKFAETCRGRERDASEPLTSDQKVKIADSLLHSYPIYKTYGVNINGWTTSHTPRPEFFITDFSPEALTKINTSKNHTGYIYSDEYDKLISSVTRTKTVNDPHQFFTSLFDGEHVSIIRKNSDSESIDITLTLMINTTTSNFKDSVNKNGFFHNGFGARILYVYNSNDYQRIDIIPSSGLTLEQFNNKMYRLLDNLYEYYYKNEDQIEFIIPENLFPMLNDIEKKTDIILDNSELPENIITTYKTRIRVMLMKLIALTEVINVTYSNTKIKGSEVTVTEEMINRGDKLLTFFVSNFIELFGAKKSLKPEQESLMAQLTKGHTYTKDYLLTLTEMSESTLRRFLESRTDMFSSEIIERKKNYTVL
jgi:hypothetical protein